jgi:hypothetical protein
MQSHSWFRAAALQSGEGVLASGGSVERLVARRLGRDAGHPASVADLGAGAARRRLVIWRRKLLQNRRGGSGTRDISSERSPPDGQCHPERSS